MQGWQHLQKETFPDFNYLRLCRCPKSYFCTPALLIPLSKSSSSPQPIFLRSLTLILTVFITSQSVMAVLSSFSPSLCSSLVLVRLLVRNLSAVQTMRLLCWQLPAQMFAGERSSPWVVLDLGLWLRGWFWAAMTAFAPLFPMLPAVLFFTVQLQQY